MMTSEMVMIRGAGSGRGRVVVERGCRCGHANGGLVVGQFGGPVRDERVDRSVEGASAAVGSHWGGGTTAAEVLVQRNQFHRFFAASVERAHQLNDDAWRKRVQSGVGGARKNR